MADPDQAVAEQRLVDEDALDARQRKRRDGARLEPRRILDLFHSRDPRKTAAGSARDLLGVGSAVARDHDDYGLAVAVEYERLHDLGELAADGFSGGLRRGCSVGELLDAHLGTGVAEVRGHALDRIGPHSRCHVSSVACATD